MKIKASLILLFAIILGSLQPAQARRDEQFKIQVNQTKRVLRNKLTVKFVALVEDSRCPVDVTCVWSGNAKVRIQVGKSNGAMKTFEINTNLQPKTISYAGYEIKLVNLDPKPRTNVRINRDGYTATFSVNKLTR